MELLVTSLSTRALLQLLLLNLSLRQPEVLTASLQEDLLPTVSRSLALNTLHTNSSHNSQE